MNKTAVILSLLSFVFSGCAVNIRSKAALLSSATDATVALASPMFATTTRQISSGTNHTCFRDSDGSLKCWGDNTYKQIKQPDALTPAAISGITPATSIPSVTLNPAASATPIAVSAELNQTCVIRSGALQCVSPFNRSPTWQTKIASGVTAVSSGLNHTCAVVSGSLQCFGDNTSGQIGTGATSASVSTPYTVFSSGVTAVAAGWYYTCAVVNGALNCFGENSTGQTGNGSFGGTVLTPFVTIASGVTAVSAGRGHTCAVVTGSLQCFGSGLYGEIGMGISSGSATPYTAIATGVTGVAVGMHHSCALVGDALKCFGRNDSRETGDFANSTGVMTGMGNVVYSPYTAIASGVTAIAAGGTNTCAVVSGALKCFGQNDRGQIGNGATAVYVGSLYQVHASGVTAVAMNWFHTCALVSDLLKCSGNDEYILQMSTFNGVSSNTLTPATVAFNSAYIVGGSYPYVGAAEFKPIAGVNNTCVIGTVGDLKCWGWNDYGQVGNGTTVSPVLTPYTVFPSGVTAVASSGYTTCAVVNGSLQCWGLNFQGALGNGLTSGNTLTPFTVFSSGVSAVTMTPGYTCAVVSGSLQCWGQNSASASPASLTPTELFSSGVTGASIGTYNACAIVSGALKCWGYNKYNGSGINNNSWVIPSTAITVIASGVTAVSSLLNHTCAVASGSLQCFGENTGGATGAGINTGFTLAPLTVISSGVTDVSVSGYYSCAIVSGALQCFGDNSYGQIGNGTNSGPVYSPYTSIASGVTGLNAGSGGTTCAIASGLLKCFGSNYYGELGLGWAGNAAEVTISTPLTLIASGVTAFAAGAGHTCAVVSGALKCMGDYYGNGATPASFTPVTVIASGVTDVAAGVGHTCAVVSGSLQCFGNNDSGQIGDGGIVNPMLPTSPYTAIPSGVRRVFAAGYTTCAVKDDLSIWCFGSKSMGLFNDGVDDFSSVLTPTKLTLQAGKLLDFSMSSSHACALLEDSGTKSMYCWGSNLAAEIVDDSIYGTGLRDVLVLTSPTLEKIELGVGDDQWSWEGGRTCVIDAGAFKCFGQNYYSQFDQAQGGTTIFAFLTVENSGVTLATARGYQSSCTLTGNDVKCWGTNNNGALATAVGPGLVGAGATILTSVGP